MKPSVHVKGAALLNDDEGEDQVAGSSNRAPVDAAKFYAEYHSHQVSHLRSVLGWLRPRPIIWLAGDSSLDNKHWLFPVADKAATIRQFAKEGMTGDYLSFLAPACNGLEQALNPPVAVKDVAYWVNRVVADRRAAGSGGGGGGGKHHQQPARKQLTSPRSVYSRQHRAEGCANFVSGRERHRTQTGSLDHLQHGMSGEMSSKVLPLPRGGLPAVQLLLQRWRWSVHRVLHGMLLCLSFVCWLLRSSFRQPC